MSKFLLELENLHLQDTEGRLLEFPDGERLYVEMWRLHWLWYDRLIEVVENFEERLFTWLREESARQNCLVEEMLQVTVERCVQGSLKDGNDPLETRSQKALRRSLMWKEKQSRVAGQGTT